ncbi:MAG TPA: hypothetical protein V6D09_15650 [Leptolyngbyaceae cyanobacterium]
MPSSQPTNSTSDSTVAQLLEIDAKLAASEILLRTQIASIQHKRISLKNVIELFDPESTTESVTTPFAATPAALTNDKLGLSTGEPATPELDISQTIATDAAAPVATAHRNQKAQKTPKNHKALKTPSVVRKTKSAEPARTPKKANNTEGWQQYVSPEFSNMAISEAVTLVLQRQPEQLLEIATVVDAIFQSQMPPPVRSKVRSQVTNILSEGARKNKWYRPQPGSYSWSSQ